MDNSLFKGIGTFLGDIGRARRARDTYHRLDAMSDIELGRRGLKRDELVAYAYESAFKF